MIATNSNRTQAPLPQAGATEITHGYLPYSSPTTLPPTQTSLQFEEHLPLPSSLLLFWVRASEYSVPFSWRSPLHADRLTPDSLPLSVEELPLQDHLQGFSLWWKHHNCQRFVFFRLLHWAHRLVCVILFSTVNQCQNSVWHKIDAH